MPKSKTICTAPFNQVCVTATGRYALCCDAVADYSFPNKKRHINEVKNVNEWFNGNYMNSVRTAMIKGKKLKECTTCYTKERTGKPSPRQWFNKNYPALTKDEKPIPFLYWLDIKFGNNCNLKCKMCFPHSSSELMKEWWKLGWEVNDPMEGQHSRVYNDYMLEDYNWPNKPENIEKLLSMAEYIDELKFTGGEPMISPKFIQFLESCIERKYAADIKLYVTTNCTQIHPRFLELAKQFRELELRVSIDGTGPTYEYIRYPAKWSRTEANFREVQNWFKESGGQLKGKLVLNFVLSYFNCHNVAEFIEKFENEVDDLDITELFDPNFMTWKMLKKEDIEKTKKQLLRLTYKHAHEEYRKPDPVGQKARYVLELLSKVKNWEGKTYLLTDQVNEIERKQLILLRDFVSAQDNLRKIHIRDYIPELEYLSK